MATAIALLSFVVAIASAIAGIRSASHARQSVAEAKRSADAAVASAQEARRTADAEEAVLAVERERLAQQRRSWDEQDAPKWSAPNAMYNDGDRLRLTLCNTGPDARIESVTLVHPFGSSVGVLQDESGHVEAESMAVAADGLVSVFFPDPQWREIATGGHSPKAVVTAVSTMHGVRSKLGVTLLARGFQQHDGTALWKPGTWRPLP